MERIGLEPGTEIGGYRVVVPLGSGAMGTVYRALDADGTPVALKVLHSSVAADPQSRERLRREIAALGRIRHPAVARVLDAEADANDLFIVTELIDGITLEDEITQRGALDPTDLYELAEQLHSALDAVHAAGVIHRDLKASNVLLSEHGPVIIDFGIAQAVGDARVTSTGLVMGTPAYLAPELVDGAEPSMATDWWGWAAVLAFAATGRAPFGVRPVQVVLARAKAGTPDLMGLGPQRAQALAEALRPNPEDRTAPTVLVEQLRLAALDGDAAEAAAGSSASPVESVHAATGETTVLPPQAVAVGEQGTAVLGAGGTRVMPMATSVPDAATVSNGPERDRVASAIAELHRYERPTPRRRTGSVLAFGLPLMVAMAIWPGRVVIWALVIVFVCRFAGTMTDALHSRRERRGVRAHDQLRVAAVSPWYAMRAALGLVPSFVVAATAVLLTGGVAWWLLDNRKWVVGGAPGNSAQVYQYVLLGSAALFVLLMWFGPLTWLNRSGARVILNRTVPRGWPTILLWVVAAALTLLLWQALVGDSPIAWAPFPEPADLQQ